MRHNPARAPRRLEPAVLLFVIPVLLFFAAPPARGHPHGASPVSPIPGGQGGALSSDLDIFADVTAWQDLDFYRLFFFAGGDTGLLTNRLQGGMAAALYPLYLAVFFNGDLFSGSGSAADRDNPAYQGVSDQRRSKTVWNDHLVLFLGNDLLGGFRFTLLFDNLEVVSNAETNNEFYEYRAPFLTSLQWGRRFGGLDARVTAGAGWGGHESWSEERVLNTGKEPPDSGTDGTTEPPQTALITTAIQDYTMLGLKLEAAYHSFAADYQFSIGLGRAETVSGHSDPAENSDRRFDTGSTEHLVNLYYTALLPVMDGMTLTLRPRLLLGFYDNPREAATGGGTEHLGSFGFSPMLEADLGWQITPKLFAGTSLSLSLFSMDFNTKDSGSSWAAEGLVVDRDASGSLDFRFAFSPSFTLEAGIDGVFDYSGARHSLDLANVQGSFALVFKPGR